MILAVIPARGGSKRIPNKNIKSFAGKPIIAYSIMAARNSGIFDRIVVSTDCKEIANVAREWGAETPFIRPKELSDDHTGTNEVTIHAIQYFQDQGEQVEYVCCLYATAPFVNAEDLKYGFELLKGKKQDFVFPATTFPFPIFRAFSIDKNKKVKSY